jgi:hypothetical protein
MSKTTPTIELTILIRRIQHLITLTGFKDQRLSNTLITIDRMVKDHTTAFETHSDEVGSGIDKLTDSYFDLLDSVDEIKYEEK